MSDSNRLEAYANDKSTLSRSLENIRIGPNAMAKWQKQADKVMVDDLMLALSDFQTWFNQTYHHMNVVLRNLGVISDWHKVTRKAVFAYRGYLIDRNESIAEINRSMAAIRIGARLALHSGSITERTNEQIYNTTLLGIPKHYVGWRINSMNNQLMADCDIDDDLVSVDKGTNAFNDWQKKKKVWGNSRLVMDFGLALFFFQTWLSSLLPSESITESLSTSGQGWIYVSVTMVSQYRDYLVSTRMLEGEVIERMAAIRIGTRLAYHAGVITEKQDRRVQLITGNYYNPNMAKESKTLTGNTELADYENSNRFKSHLESVEQGETTFNQWRKLQAIDILVGFDTALLRLEAWLNEFYSRYDVEPPSYGFLSTSGDDWPYVEVHLIENYKKDLTFGRNDTTFINEQIAAIKIGALVAVRSGKLSKNRQLTIGSISSIDYLSDKDLLG